MEKDVYTIKDVGLTRELLPDGSMLCRDVPIARTGPLVYGAEELKGALDTNGDPMVAVDGLICIHRDEDVLFDTVTIQSLESVPVTLGHPDEFINPENYQELAQGNTRNVRRGEGIYTDFIVADLILRSRELIDTVKDNLIRGISPGYTAQYEPIPDRVGHYRQVNFIGNHVAVVKRPRGGSMVKIGDSMSIKKRLFSVSRVRDEDTVTETDKHAELLGAIGSLAGKIDKVYDMLNSFFEETTEEVQDEVEIAVTPDEVVEVPAEEEAPVEEVTKEVIQGVEVIAPGLKVEVADADLVRRSALRAALNGENAAHVRRFLAGKKISQITADAAQVAFVAVKDSIERENRQKATAHTIKHPIRYGTLGGGMSAAELNKQNSQFWNEHLKG